MNMRLFACVLVAVSLGSCSGKQPPPPPVASASVSIGHARVPLGSPVEMKYRFVVSQGAKIDGDYRVFVHFLDKSREMMWADDHFPPVPTSQWKPGQVVEYTRTMFAPVYPYVGESTVEVGLYQEKGKRLPLGGGIDKGHQSYQVAKFELLPQTENVFLIYRDGWHATELGPEGATVDWQWTKKEAGLAFRNPKRDVVFYLHVDQPPKEVPTPTVTVRLGDQVVDTFVPAGDTLRKVPLSAAQLGQNEMAEMKIDVDKTFVPAQVTGLNVHDSRELGIRVFHAFIEPR